MVVLRPIAIAGHLLGENIQSSYLFSPGMMMMEKRQKKAGNRNSDKKAHTRPIRHAWDTLPPILSPAPPREYYRLSTGCECVTQTKGGLCLCA